MFDSDPKVDSNGFQALLNTWKRIGKLDLDELHKLSEIDLSQDLEYEETTDGDCSMYGQMKEGKLNGLGRKIYKNYNRIYEG